MKDGFVFCESFFSLERVNSIRSKIDDLIANGFTNLPPSDIYFEDKSQASTLKQIQRLHLHDPFFADLIQTGPIRNLAESLLGEEVVPKNLQYFNKPPLVGQATPPHQDGFYFKIRPHNAVTLWMALEKVDHENGCVRYVRGSHKLKLRNHRRTETLGFSQGIFDFPTENDLENEVSFPCQAGDLLAHHSLTIHRAEPNQSATRTRRAIGLIYYGASAVEDKNAHQEYQESLAKDLLRSGKI